MSKQNYEPQTVPEKPGVKARRRFIWALTLFITLWYIVFGGPTWFTLLWQVIIFFLYELIISLSRRKSLYLRVAYWWYRLGAMRGMKQANKRQADKNVHQYRDDLKKRL